MLDPLSLPKNAPDDAYSYWINSLQTVYESPQWQETMARSGLLPFWKSGTELEAVVEQQVSQLEALSREVGVIK